MSPTAKPTKPIDLYIRVSDVHGREGESFISPDIQEERCRATLAAGGYEAGKVFTDLDETGRKMSRPAFDEVMERALHGDSGGIVVWKLSRFGRTTKGVLDAVEQLEKAGAVLLSTTENLDTSTSMGRFVLGIFAGLAELESEQIRESWEAAHTSMIRRGVHGGRLPAGYVKDPETQRLVPNEHADTIREAFRLKADQPEMTWRDLARFLTEQKVPTQVQKKNLKTPSGRVTREKDGTEPWTGNAARLLIMNRVYLGEARHGERVNPAAHEALVDERTFRRAGAKKRRTSGDRGNGHLLGGGLVRCGICGAGMVKTRSTVSETQSEYLRCQTPGKGHPTIQVGAIEQYLAKETLVRVKMIGSEWVPIEVPEEIRNRLTIVLAEIEELGDMLDAGDLKPTPYAKAVSVAEKEADELRETIATYERGEYAREVSPAGRRQHEGAVALIERVVTFSDLGRATLLGALPPADVRKARQLIRETLGTITLSPGRGPAETRVRFPAKDEEEAAAA